MVAMEFSRLMSWNDYGNGSGIYRSGSTAETTVQLAYLGDPKIVAKGPVYAWGRNIDGECNVPAPNTDFTAITGGSGFSIGLKIDSSLEAWGDNFYGVCNIPAPNENFVKISAARFYCLGLKRDGTLVVWGGTFGSPNPGLPSPNADFIDIVAGAYHCLGLKRDGSIVAWGRNDFYCVSRIPVPNSGFIAVGAGIYTSLALRSNGAVEVWGWNGSGQGVEPIPNTDFVAISSGVAHHLALKSDGSIVQWGYDWGAVPEPNSGFTKIACGYGHNLALKSDGVIITWGWNERGQLNVPEPNSGFTVLGRGSGMVYHSLAIKTTSSSIGPILDELRDAISERYGDANWINTLGYPTSWNTMSLTQKVQKLQDGVEYLVDGAGGTLSIRHKIGGDPEPANWGSIPNITFLLMQGTYGTTWVVFSDPNEGSVYEQIREAIEYIDVVVVDLPLANWLTLGKRGAVFPNDLTAAWADANDVPDPPGGIAALEIPPDPLITSPWLSGGLAVAVIGLNANQEWLPGPDGYDWFNVPPLNWQCAKGSVLQRVGYTVVRSGIMPTHVRLLINPAVITGGDHLFTVHYYNSPSWLPSEATVDTWEAAADHIEQAGNVCTIGAFHHDPSSVDGDAQSRCYVGSAVTHIWTAYTGPWNSE